jgi:2-desacetyl-2-hydroxyethyl bacteriochlorophyllide A dehydrogenase
MDLDQKKMLLTQIIGRFYQNIYFSSYSPLQVQNLPRQSLPENSWVRVRNRLSGISGSDLHLLYQGGKDPRVASAATPNQTQLYPGHEVVGEVIEIGDDVQRLQVGDRVALQWKPNCVTAGVQPICQACANENFNLCEHGAFLAPPALGGGWSEEMLLHEQQLFRVPIGLTDEQAVMLEPAATAAHAVLRHLPRPGDRVLIIGAGTVGLLTQQIIRALVPQAEISVLARYSFQVEQATRLGAANIIYQQDAYVGVQQATQARMYHGLFGNRTLQGGYDVIYDTVGQKKSVLHQNTLHHDLRWIRTQGTIVLVGLSLRSMHIDLTPLWTQEITLLGSQAHGMEYWPTDGERRVSTFKVAAELMLQGNINPEQLITHHFAVNNYKHALLTAKKKADSRAIKVVFDYSLLPASVVPNVRASAPRIRRQSTINFANDYEDMDQQQEEQPERSSYFPPKEPARRKEIPSAQPHTKELAKSPKTPALEEEDEDEFDNDDTASALPIVGRHSSTNFRTYSSASHTQMPAMPDTQIPDNIPSEPYEAISVPATPINNEAYQDDDDATAYQDDDDATERTQLISKAQFVPQTETNLDPDTDAIMQGLRVTPQTSKDRAVKDLSNTSRPQASVDIKKSNTSANPEVTRPPVISPPEINVAEHASPAIESDEEINHDIPETFEYDPLPEEDNHIADSFDAPETFEYDPLPEEDNHVSDSFDTPEMFEYDPLDTSNEELDPEIPLMDDSETISPTNTSLRKERPLPTYAQQRSRNRKKRPGGR